MRTVSLCLIVLIGCGSLSGCRRGEKAAVASGVQKAEGAMFNVAKALQDDDKGLFLATVETGGDDELATILFESLRAMCEFAKKFDRQYGAGASRRGTAMFPPTVKEVEDTCRIETRDGRTVAVVVDEPYKLIYTDGRWKVDWAPRNTAHAVEVKAMIRKMTAAFVTAEWKIGQPQYNADPRQILREIVAASPSVPSPK